MLLSTLCALSLSVSGAYAADKSDSDQYMDRSNDGPSSSRKFERSAIERDDDSEMTGETPPAERKSAKKSKKKSKSKPVDVPEDEPEPSVEQSTDGSSVEQPYEERSTGKSQPPLVKRSIDKSSEPRSLEQSTKKSVESPSEESLVKSTDDDESGSVTASSAPPLLGQTEVTELILDEIPLYKQAIKSIEEEDYGRAVYYLKELNAQLGEEGYEPYLAECTYIEAGCHQMLNRMNAAIDMYHKSFELFEKYDERNPLKGKAWHQYSELKRLKAQYGTQQNTLQAGIQQNKILAGVQQKHAALVPQRARFAIDPDALLVVRDNNPAPLLEVNDRTVLPRIVKECFSEMSCLETAEIGSNVTNAEERWFPLMVHGKSAAFAMNGAGHPTFRANVNGRSYLFDVILPDLAPGIRKVLLVTNKEKICAVDVDSFDTWLLRMQRASDGRVITARWYKLTHKKNHAPFVSPIAKPNDIKNPASIRKW